MATTSPPPPYILGNTDAEHERLIRQAAGLEPTTERLFRDAGIRPGMRVLDIGAGVGDVSLLAARLVGPKGSVTGVDRDAAALAKARSRAAAAGAEHVRFVESDVSGVPADTPFDAVVGRFILQFVSDPVSLLRSLATRLRPGGILVFQEPSWASVVPLRWSRRCVVTHSNPLMSAANHRHRCKSPSMRRDYPTLKRGHAWGAELAEVEASRQGQAQSAHGFPQMTTAQPSGTIA